MYLVSWFVSYEDTIGGVGFLVRVGCMVFLLWVLMFGCGVSVWLVCVACCLLGWSLVCGVCVCYWFGAGLVGLFRCGFLLFVVFVRLLGLFNLLFGLVCFV